MGRLCKLRLSQFGPRPDIRRISDSLAMFQKCPAGRYRPSAFANVFERGSTRETKLAEKIANAVNPWGELISGVFFDVDEGKEVSRDGADDKYTLDITIAPHREPDFESADRTAQAVAQGPSKERPRISSITLQRSGSTANSPSVCQRFLSRC